MHSQQKEERGPCDIMPCNPQLKDYVGSVRVSNFGGKHCYGDIELGTLKGFGGSKVLYLPFNMMICSSKFIYFDKGNTTLQFEVI